MAKDYKLKLLEDVIHYCSSPVSLEEVEEFKKSPIYQDDDYFHEICILLKMDLITVDEFLCLRYVSENDLSLYLNNIGYRFDEEFSNDSLIEGLIIMDSPKEKDEINKQIDREFREKIIRIKELYESMNSKKTR